MSDGKLSDVYVYADISGGWTTHIAYNRIIKGKKQRLAANLFVSRTRKLNHPERGAVFNDDTREATVARLLSLKSSGLRVPRCAINRLLDEIYS